VHYFGTGDNQAGKRSRPKRRKKEERKIRERENRKTPEREKNLPETRRERAKEPTRPTSPPARTGLLGFDLLI
jgi:hypothetical protein